MKDIGGKIDRQRNIAAILPRRKGLDKKCDNGVMP